MKGYFIGALVGAVIGYITNWLAIKMLFRPHEEKRVFGIKVPFTPGLIPKEKERIAKSVGSTVGEHLLTTNVISEALGNDEIKKNLKGAIANKIDEVWCKNLNLEELLKSILGNKFDSINKKAKTKSKDAVLKAIKSDKFLETLTLKISSKVMEELNSSPKLIHELVNSKKLRAILAEFLGTYKESEDFKAEIKKFINKEIQKIGEEDKKINEVIPDEITKVVESVIYSQKDFIVEELINALIEGSLSSKIKSIINANIPSMMAMFISIDSIYERIISVASAYLREEENKMQLCRFIVASIEKLGEHNVNDVIENLSESQVEAIANGVEKILNERILCDENILEVINKIENYIVCIESYHDILIRFDEDYEHKITNYISSKTFELVNSEEINQGLENIINETIEGLLKVTINSLIDNKNDLIEIIYGIIENRYDDFIENDASKLIESINITGLVENQINSFEVSYAEEIILSIAKKELGAITWLGALLGAILGILSPILASLYM